MFHSTTAGKNWRPSFLNRDRNEEQPAEEQIHTRPAFLDNLPAQMQAEEEEVQAKENAAQMQDEEEELQMKESPAQLTEEEELQAKMETTQLAEEDEELQMQEAPAQGAKDEELMQGKAVQKKSPAQLKKNGSKSGMPSHVQAKMEGSFSTDFSNVNIHANDDSATQMGALAYTRGNDVHFAPGQYNPGSQKGQELLGHELTHVVQQRQGRVAPTKQGKGMPVNDSPTLEKEADDMGKRAAGGIINSQINNINNQSKSDIVQGYFAKTIGSDDYRISDDLSVAVIDNYPNHVLFAKSGKAALANNALSSVGSGIELEEQSQQKHFTDGTNTETLKKILPKNNINHTTGNSMDLWADCGKSCGVVVGSETRAAIYNDPSSGNQNQTMANSPALMKAEIMKNWLENEKTRFSIAPVDKGNIESTLNTAASIKSEIDQLIVDYGNAITDVDRENIADNYHIKVDQYAEEMMLYYNSRPSSEQDSIDQELGINKYVNPDVGEGYTMSSGGTPVSGFNTWNFHWGGVVMKSNDSKDNVTLENYAVGDPSVENKLWDFAMYGTYKSKQTFHEQHRDTNQHGDSPTTMNIKKE